MLVLSRKLGESVELPGLGVVIRVTGLKRSRVQLGIKAPPEIVINRSERSCEPGATNRALESDRIRDELSRVEAELTALAELASQNHGDAAGEIASRSIQRIRGIRRSLHIAMRSTDSDVNPVSEFVRVRGDVLDNLRRKKPAETQVQQSRSVYQVRSKPGMSQRLGAEPYQLKLRTID